MRITWFGGRTLRVHIGGQILVWHPSDVGGVAPQELLSGADLVIPTGTALAQAAAATWQPRRAPTALAAGAEIAILAIGPDAALVDAPGESPLLLIGGASPPGRWAHGATVVAFSPTAATGALDVLDPKLIALAMELDDADEVFARLRDRLGGTVLAALEPGLALEV